MKAYVLDKIAEFNIKNVEEKEPADGEVLVKVKAAGICGSDIPRVYYTGTYHYPLIPGHEFSGVVEKDGRRVGIFPLIPCKKCGPCKKMLYEMCRNYDYVGSRRDGAFSEAVTVPEWNLIDLPNNVTFEQAAMMEPMAVATHAMRKALGDNGDKCRRVAVCGLGTIGLLLLMFLKEAGYEDILVVGNKEIQKEKAVSLGIEPCKYFDLKASEKVDEWLLNMEAEKEIDVFFDCVGRNEVVELAVKHTCPGGTVMLVGNPYSDMKLERNTYWKILRNQLTVLGTWNSSFTKSEDDDWNYVLKRLADERISPEKLISHRFEFDNLMQGFELMRDKKEEYVKVMGIFE